MCRSFTVQIILKLNKIHFFIGALTLVTDNIREQGCYLKMISRTNGQSDQWAVGPMGRASDQWVVGLLGRRTIGTETVTWGLEIPNTAITITSKAFTPPPPPRKKSAASESKCMAFW